LVKKLTAHGDPSEIVWEKTKPNDSRADVLIHQSGKRIRLKATTKFDDGLKKTVEW
jgi:hypothetical protein